MGGWLLFFGFLISGFVQKWYIPKGLDFGAGGKICSRDVDRDGHYELIFATYVGGGYTLYFYKYIPPNTWQVDSLPHPNHPLNLWDIGDFDGDGLYDIVTQRGEAKRWWVGISIFESPDSFSYPTQEVWRDTVGQGLVVPICVYDIDKDGIPEIVKVLGDYIHLHIYESVDDNLYDKIAEITTSVPNNSSSTLAFSDFDSDNQNEFVWGYSAGQYSIFECIGNNSYHEIISQQLPTRNIKDCFTVPDADGDGKLEFVVKGFVFDTNPFSAFIFEATGNNTYEIVKTFVLSGLVSWWYGGGYSDVGDVDGDSVPEIALEADAYVYLIKSCGDDSFYLWDTLPGNYNGSCVRVTNDLDNNGLNEIVISGGNQTRIYEKTPEVAWFCPEPYDTFWANDTVYPRWRLDETIALDSLRLYWAHPQFGCHLIYEGLPADTMCSWVVPDTQSNMGNRLWLVVKGNGRYDSTYSPVFYIKRAPGIEETVRQGDLETGRLEVYPNPFTDKVTIKFQIRSTKSKTNSSLQNPKLATLKICDVTGRLVRDFSQVTLNGKCSTVIWNGMDDSGCKLPVGVYFVRLETEGFKKVEKAILLR
ncbi:MAG: T9SS type A sorting domain-containing protein [candidate division WOR-3 bacterium]